MFLKLGFVNRFVSYLELKKLRHRVRGEIYLWLPSCIVSKHLGLAKRILPVEIGIRMIVFLVHNFEPLK